MEARLVWSRASVGLLVVAAVLSAAVFLDYGITWDEGVQSTYGELALDYYLSGGEDRRCNTYEDLRYYGAAFEMTLAAVYRAVDGHKYEIRHAGIGLMALLTLAAVWRFGRMLGSARVAFLAMLALTMMPRFVGHAFNNSKDIPFACGFAWAMVGLARLLRAKRWTWPDALLCGAGIGLALSMRVGALLLFGFLAVGIAGAWLLLPDERRRWAEERRPRLLRLAAIVALAWALMVLLWPWALQSPLTRPFVAMAEMADFGQSYATLFDGEYLESAELPRHYLPLYLGITTPLVLLGLGLVGLARAMAELVRFRDRSSTTVILLLLWFLFPLAYFVAQRPNVYDGLRHFLFLLPALALLCGVGASWLLERAGPRFRPAATVALILALLLPLRDHVGLHPYQSTFFNATVGGVGSAWRRYETDYWTSSYREAMLWIVDRAALTPEHTTRVVVACSVRNRPCAQTYVAFPGSTTTMLCVWEGDERIPPNADYFVGTLRYGKASSFFTDWPIVHRIERRGAPFTVIKRRPGS